MQTLLLAPPATSRASLSEASYRRILGVRFFVGGVDEAVRLGLRGGLVVAPAAPNMCVLATDHGTREALLKADLAITDSSLMVLLWNLLQRERIPRVSGLKYLKRLLKEPALRQPGNVFWVMPGKAAKARALAWLRNEGFPAQEDDFYVAPFYGSAINDSVLLETIRRRRAAHVVMGLGGGTQERLGLYLRDRLDSRPSIHCIGAAIGFLTGDQVSIPDWADHFYLGWLIRCLHRPKLFVPRYWRSRKLVWIMLKHRDRLPMAAQDSC